MSNRLHIFGIAVCFFIYIVLVYTFYWKPPWLIDQLIYVLIANPENISDLNFWHDGGVSVLPGHHNERWSVLLPIRISTLIFSDIFNPGAISSGLTFCIYALIFLFVGWYVWKSHGSTSALIFSILYLIGVHHSKNRATELLADPFAVLYISVALVAYLYWWHSSSRKTLFFAGFFGILPAFAKAHYGIFFVLLLVFVFISRKKTRDLVPIFWGAIAAVFFQCALILVLYPSDIAGYIFQSSARIYLGYISGGLGVSDNAGLGHSMLWIEIFSKPTFLPAIFVISLFFPVTETTNRPDILQSFSIVFLTLIIFLSAFSNFPANDSYAFPLYVFAPAVFSMHLAYSFKKASIANYKLIISLVIFITLGLLGIYFLGAVPNSKFYVSSLAIYYLGSFALLSQLIHDKLSRRWADFTAINFILITSFGVFFHNWKNIENHYWWRDGYNWHYNYFNAISELPLQSADATYVLFSTWPYNLERSARELMYVEPGIKSHFLDVLNIYPILGSVDITTLNLSPGSQIISDFNISVPGIIPTGSANLDADVRGFEGVPHAETVFSYIVEQNL